MAFPVPAVLARSYSGLDKIENIVTHCEEAGHERATDDTSEVFAEENLERVKARVISLVVPFDCISRHDEVD